MPAQNILEQWVQLIQQLQRGVTYEEVTDEERREIIRGLMGGSYEFGELRSCDLKFWLC